MVKLNLRIPDEMKTELVDAAWKARRSLNAEIVYRLGRDMEWEKRFFAEAEKKALRKKKK